MKISNVKLVEYLVVRAIAGTAWQVRVLSWGVKGQLAQPLSEG